MFQNIGAVVYHASDLAAARSWYISILGVQPTVDEQFYVGFKVGSTDLGLDPNAEDTPGGNAGIVAYWAVEDINAALARLLELGATQRGNVQVMDELRLVTVLDPFGNILGIIQYQRQDG